MRYCLRLNFLLFHFFLLTITKRIPTPKVHFCWLISFHIHLPLHLSMDCPENEQGVVQDGSESLSNHGCQVVPEICFIEVVDF